MVIQISDLVAATADIPLCKDNCHSCYQPMDGEVVELVVSDTGSGIDPKIREKIFEPFYTTKAIDDGTGMGLSVIHGIVHEHSGHILVDSAPDQGTTFRTLWRPAPAGVTSDHFLTKEETEQSMHTNIRIMVVDDEESIAHYLHDLLEDQGFEVIEMTNSLEAIAYCINYKDEIDLIITDLTMPHMSGKELAQTLLKKHIDIPVIIASGFPQNISKDEMWALGICGFVNKPVDFPDLLATIYSATEKPTKC